MKRRGFMRAGLAGAAGLALGGCGSGRPKPVDFSEGVRSYKPRDYDGVRERWTRHGILVKDIGTVIEFWATFKSWEFRQAYVEQYSETYSLGETDRKALYRAQLEAARVSYEFHVIAQSTNWKWNDLEQKDSVWRSTLADGAGHEIGASSIVVERLPELYEMRFFPNRTDFSRSYLFRFPRSGPDMDQSFAGIASGRLQLRVSGPLGRAEAGWESR